MPDYGLNSNKLEFVSGSIYLFSSASLAIPGTAISASTPQILAITCSSNLNNRLTPPNNTSSFSIISFSTGNNQQRLVLRYISGSYDSQNKIKSVTPAKFLPKTTGARDKYVDIPVLNNDDSFAVAYKTVHALSKTSGFNNYFSASLNNIGTDDINTTGVGSIEIEHDFIVGQYPGGTGLSSLSSSLGINKAVGSTFRIRAGDGVGDITIGNNFIVDKYEPIGSFKIFNFLSGSVGKADFSGSMVQVGGMMVGSSFKIGGSTQLFQHNIVQTGSGVQNQPFYIGDPNISSASLGILIDPVDNVSAMITGSNQSASLYFSASGQIGMGTTEPQSDFDITADQFQVRSRRDSRGIFINEDGNIESFNRTTEGASTGSEFIMSYARGGTSGITAQLVSLVLFGASSPGIRGREDRDDVQEEANRFITASGGLTTYINEEEPDVLRKILDIGEREGILGTKAAAGDILGSLRWVADSGSFDKKFYDARGGGEMLKIQGEVIESTEAGIRGDMLFFTSPGVAEPTQEVMRIASDGKIHITGSLNVTGDITYQDELVIHTTASGNISASGEITAESFRLGDGRIYFPANNSILYSNNAVNFAGTDPYIFPNSNITASGDISSSGLISAANFHVPGQGRISFDNTDTDDQFIKGLDHSIVIDGDDTVRIKADKYVEFADNSNNAKVSIDGNNGHITASGNISGSGTSKITAQDLTLDRALVVGGDITANGNIVGDDSTDITNIRHVKCDAVVADSDADVNVTLDTSGMSFNINAGDSFQFNTDFNSNTDLFFKDENEDAIFMIDASAKRIGVGVTGGDPQATLDVNGNGRFLSSVNVVGNVTSSGVISASGEVIASDFVMDQNTNGIKFRASNGTLFNNILTNANDDFIVQNLKNGENLRLRAGQSGNKGKVLIQQGGTSTSIAEFGPTNSVNIVGNVTASGAISSSVAVRAPNVRALVQLKGDDIYLSQLNAQNRYYHIAYAAQSIGTAINGANVADSTAIRMTSFVATGNCTIHKITLAFYMTVDASLEFVITKVPLINDSSEAVTLSAMTATNCDGEYSGNVNYVKTFTVTGGNTLTVGQGLAVAIRRTTSSTTNLFGVATAEIELT